MGAANPENIVHHEMKNKPQRIDPEWSPDVILCALSREISNVQEDEYQRALWLWQRRPKRLLYRRICLSIAVLLAATIVNVLTFLWPDSEVKAGLIICSYAADSVGIILSIVVLYEAYRWGKWFTDYWKAIDRVLRK